MTRSKMTISFQCHFNYNDFCCGLLIAIMYVVSYYEPTLSQYRTFFTIFNDDNLTNKIATGVRAWVDSGEKMKRRHVVSGIVKEVVMLCSAGTRVCQTAAQIATLYV